MNTRTKWSILPVALLAMGTVALAQSQTPAAQASGSTAPAGAQSGPLTAVGAPSVGAKEEPLYGEINGAVPGDPATLIANAGVNRAIDGLTRAFAAKNMVAVKQLWPSIPQKQASALEKSLGYFKTVSRNFKPDKIDVNGDAAVVDGSYSGAFVKGQTIIPSSGDFHATLARIGTTWILTSLECK